MSSTAENCSGPLPAKLSPSRTAELSQLLDGLDLLDHLFRLPTGGDEGDVPLGRFRIRSRLGAGRNGVVFLAEDPELRRQVVVKVPQPAVLADPDLQARFFREARAAARLDHAGIVPVFEVGLDRGLGYIVAGLVEGPTLACWLAEQQTPLNPGTAARLVERLASAVHHAHERGVLHCDLKPANIMLAQTGSVDTGIPGVGCPRVTDFGLARILEDDPSLTRTYQMAGTPLYMSPEQARGERRALTARTDIYSLGVILYELLCRRLPFNGDSLEEIFEQVASRRPTPLRSVSLSVPCELEMICLKCLEKLPQKRYVSADELAADLRRFLGGEPITARLIGTAESAWRRRRRKPLFAALTATLLTSLGIAIGAFWFGPGSQALAVPVEDTGRQGSDTVNPTASGTGVTMPVTTVKTIVSPSNQVYELHTDGSLSVNGTPTFTGIKNFQVDVYGRLVTLSRSGELRFAGRSWQGYESLAFEGDTGRLFALRHDGMMYNLQSQTDLQTEGTGFKQLGTDEYGRVVTLSRSGELNIPGWYSWQGYSSVAFEGRTGKVYALTMAGTLKNLADSKHWAEVATGIKQMGTDEYGRLVTLGQDGVLSVAGWNSWQGYKSIAIEGGTGKLYTLRDDGVVCNLQSATAWHTVWTGIKQLRIDEHGRPVTVR